VNATGDEHGYWEGTLCQLEKKKINKLTISLY
jgi:hypothetical protein